MTTTDRPAVADALDAVIATLDAIVERSLNPRYHEEVAAETVRLRQVISRAKLALSFVEAQKPTDIRRAN